MTDKVAEALRETLPDSNGFISFGIKAQNTEDHSKTHEAFKEFAKMECGNDYTLALKTLLLYYQEDAKFEALWEYVKDIKFELDEIRATQQDIKGQLAGGKQEDKENATF